MKPLRQFAIIPSLPIELEPLRELALNLWWTWDYEAIRLFQHLDTALWEKTYHNPIHMLGIMPQQRLDALARDDAFLSHLNLVVRKFQDYMTATSPYEKHLRNTDLNNLSIAYFSAEFGLAECLPIYSGGLGILAGDYLKSASYLGLPMVGVGLLYQHGYFRQILTSEGWQMADYPLNDFYNMPIQVERQEDGSPVVVDVDYPEGKAYAQIWRIQIGKIPLYLLDTNIPDNNHPELRNITSYLYGGDEKTRIKQEILLGVGGFRALLKLGIRPTVCHMNEGHAAFLAIERIRHLIEEQHLTFEEARSATTAGNVFTTHTPVPAGIDWFPPSLVDYYFGGYYSSLGISREEFLALGRDNFADNGSEFSTTVLALRLSAYNNGVSKVHGKVSRSMWNHLWHGLPEDEVPIRSITNGVHIRSWVAGDMQNVFERYLGPGWIQNLVDEKSVWTQVDGIPDVELWRTHEHHRERLVAFVRQKLRDQSIRAKASSAEIKRTNEILNPEILTIGFARRFPTYKRATLLFQDPDRLDKILNHSERPVQIIFSGKAHPHDHEGKLLIQEICKFAAQDRFQHRIVFIEDYDICVARCLVAGVDVWLNNPLPLQEASGTSGMKVAVNGGLNLSILDGWWAEAHTSGGGWTIGGGEVYDDRKFQDQVEADAIYDILEKEVVPLFYDRESDTIPHRWVAKIKLAMRNLAPIFNTKRMVSEYADKLYFSTHRRWDLLNRDDVQRGKALAHWKSHLQEHWSRIKIKGVEDEHISEIGIGEELNVKSYVDLAALSPHDVNVQIYHGTLNEDGEINAEDTIPMESRGQLDDGTHLFEGAISSYKTGLHGYTVRILPCHDDLHNPHDLALIHWAS